MGVSDWSALAPELLSACFVHLDEFALHRSGLTCRSWGKIADANELWKLHVQERLPEACSLVGVRSFKQLFGKLMIVDIKTVQEPLRYMVRLEWGSSPRDLIDGVWHSRRDDLDGKTLLACTLHPDQAVDGIWRLPSLDLSVDAAVELARLMQTQGYMAVPPPMGAVFLAGCRLKLTVTIFRVRDGSVLRMLRAKELNGFPGDCPDGWELDDTDKLFHVEPVEYAWTRSQIEQQSPDFSFAAVLRSERDSYQLLRTDEHGHSVPDLAVIQAFREGLSLELGWCTPPYWDDDAYERWGVQFARKLRRQGGASLNGPEGTYPQLQLPAKASLADVLLHDVGNWK